MALETATYVNDLVSSNPPGSDLRSQGDDHIRLLKATLLATFKNFSRAIYCPTTAASQTSTVTVASTDENKIIPINADSAAITVNLPQGSTLPDGWEVSLIKTDHSRNLITINPFAGDTINSDTAQQLWQAQQHTSLRWSGSSGVSGWLSKREYIPPKGEITAFIVTDTLPPGWLYCNGQTIGDASSGASARASSDTKGLFQYLWSYYSDTVCPVSGGRGGTSLGDFNAHKRIGLPNLCGRTIFGLDNMGGVSDQGVLTTTTDGQTNGEAFGGETQTIAQANLPSVNFTLSASFSGSAVADHQHLLFLNGNGSDPAGSITLTNAQAAYVAAFSSGTDRQYNIIGAAGTASLGLSSPAGAHTPAGSVSGTAASGGSGTAFSRMPPAFMSSWKIKI